MNNAPAPFDREFDQGMLEQLGTLRILRLNMAENLLKNLDATSEQLVARGLIAAVDQGELRQELTERIRMIRERLAQPERIYSDEIAFYDELVDHDLVDDEVEWLDDEDEDQV